MAIRVRARSGEDNPRLRRAREETPVGPVRSPTPSSGRNSRGRASSGGSSRPASNPRAAAIAGTLTPNRSGSGPSSRPNNKPKGSAAARPPAPKPKPKPATPPAKPTPRPARAKPASASSSGSPKLKTMDKTQRLNYEQLIKTRGKAAADKLMRSMGFKV